MTNEEILRGQQPTVSKELTPEEERVKLLAERAAEELAEHEYLRNAGADYSGKETWRAFMRRCGRSQ